jgi:hypothetical protein
VVSPSLASRGADVGLAVKQRLRTIAAVVCLSATEDLLQVIKLAHDDTRSPGLVK